MSDLKPEDLTDADVQTYFDRASKPSTREAVVQVYSDWAPIYDETIGRFGRYLTPDRVAELLSGAISDYDITILDVACGSGLVSEALQKRGFRNFIGLDLSKAMLDRSAGKNCYRLLVLGDLHQPLPFSDASFSAIVCAGAFSEKQIRPEALSNIIATLRPGGVFACDIEFSSWLLRGFREEVETIIAKGNKLEVNLIPGIFIEELSLKEHGYYVLIKKCY